MRLVQKARTLLLSVLLLAVGVGWYAAGWPIAQRMEEYLAYVTSGEVRHDELVAATSALTLGPRTTGEQAEHPDAF